MVFPGPRPGHAAIDRDSAARSGRPAGSGQTPGATKGDQMRRTTVRCARRDVGGSGSARPANALSNAGGSDPPATRHASDGARNTVCPRRCSRLTDLVKCDTMSEESGTSIQSPQQSGSVSAANSVCPLCGAWAEPSQCLSWAIPRETSPFAPKHATIPCMPAGTTAKASQTSITIFTAFGALLIAGEP